MNHHEIEQQEIIERYVLNRLNPNERRAFQEHLFDCLECFEQAQMSAKFIAGVRRSSRVGVLSKSADRLVNDEVGSWFVNWFKPALTLAAATAVILAVVLGWVVFKQMPKLHEQLASERRGREQAIQDSQRNLEQAKRELEAEREQAAKERAEREKLQNRLDEIAQNRAPQFNGSVGESQTDLPIVLLEAQRDAKAGSNQLTLPVNARSAILWIEVETGNRYRNYQLEVFSDSRQLITRIAPAKPNSYGAVAVSIPARNLPTGKYLVKAYGVNEGEKELVGEYDLMIHR